MGVSPSFEECVPASLREIVLLTYDVLSRHQFADGDEHLFVSGCGRCSSDGVPAFDASLDGDVVVHIVPDSLGELLELVNGELLELLVVVDAVSDRFSDDSVGLTEGNVKLWVRDSKDSIRGFLSSWRSLLYVRGRPLVMTSMLTNVPMTAPVLPLTSSAMSGFFF